MTDEEAKTWAKYFIELANNFYEYSDIYEDEDFVDAYPDEEDWQKVHDLMVTANIEVSWDD